MFVSFFFFIPRRKWKALKLSCWIACLWGVPRLCSQLLLRRLAMRKCADQLGRTWWENWKSIWPLRRAPWCKYFSAACCSVKTLKRYPRKEHALKGTLHWEIVHMLEEKRDNVLSNFENIVPTYLLIVLRLKARTLFMLYKCSITESHSQPLHFSRLDFNCFKASSLKTVGWYLLMLGVPV